MKVIRRAALFCLTLLLLVGSSSAAGGLYIPEEPLIDLSKAIQIAPPGSNAMTPSEPQPSSPSSPSGGSSGSAAVEADREVRIVIRDQRITFGRAVWTGAPEEMEPKIRENGTAKFILVDDYAEAHVYRNVLGILRRLHEETGLRYSEDAS